MGGVKGWVVERVVVRRWYIARVDCRVGVVKMCQKAWFSKG